MDIFSHGLWAALAAKAANKKLNKFKILRRSVWETGGWLLHIIIDIPTHSYKFYPTPFLWPLSDWKFDGLSWTTPWFIVINYLAIIAVYLMLRKSSVRKRPEF